MGLGVRDRVLTASDIPFAPRRDDGQIRCKGGIRELEANLIVTLAGAAVGQCIGPDPPGNLNLTTRDQRATHGSAEQVLPAVNGTGTQGRPHEVLHELLTEILDIALIRT